MVSAIVSLLSTVGSALPVYVRHGLVRVINGQPCADVGGGDYRPVVIDVEGGVLYWRQTGKMRVDAADIMSPCAGVRVRVPLRLVAVVEVGVCDDPTSRAMLSKIALRYQITAAEAEQYARMVLSKIALRYQITAVFVP